MSDAALVWIAVFMGSALLFFGIAVVAGVRGLIDLRHLLRGARRRGRGATDRGEDHGQRGREA